MTTLKNHPSALQIETLTLNAATGAITGTRCINFLYTAVVAGKVRSHLARVGDG